MDPAFSSLGGEELVLVMRKRCKKQTKEDDERQRGEKKPRR
jgi:hypothetical protein